MTASNSSGATGAQLEASQNVSSTPALLTGSDKSGEYMQGFWLTFSSMAAMMPTIIAASPAAAFNRSYGHSLAIEPLRSLYQLLAKCRPKEPSRVPGRYLDIVNLLKTCRLHMCPAPTAIMWRMPS